VTTTDVNSISEIPRTIDGIKSLSTMKRYRFALTLGAIQNDEGSITGYSARSIDQQAQLILNKLLEMDAAGVGQPTAAPQPLRQPAPMSSPMASPAPLAPPSNGMGAPLMVPPAMGTAPTPGPLGPPMPLQQPPMGQAPPYAPPVPMQAPIPRTPDTGLPNTAAPMPTITQPLPTIPTTMGAPPPPQTVAVPMGQLTQPGGFQQPGVAPQTPASPAAQSLTAVLERLGKIQLTLDQEVPGLGDIEEVLGAVVGLSEIVMGMNKFQQTLMVMLMMVLEKQNPDVPRSMLLSVISEEVRNETTKQILARLSADEQKAGPTQGK
jgi:hypothetical protein